MQPGSTATIRCCIMMRGTLSKHHTVCIALTNIVIIAIRLSSSLSLSYMHIDGVHILNDRLYCHRTICINHTSYDMRREQDTINPRTHPDVMVLSSDPDGHPYWYARVLQIFYVNVCYVGPGATYASQKWQKFGYQTY